MRRHHWGLITSDDLQSRQLAKVVLYLTAPVVGRASAVDGHSSHEDRKATRDREKHDGGSGNGANLPQDGGAVRERASAAG